MSYRDPLDWGGPTFPGYVGMLKPKSASPAENSAFQISDQERTDRDNAISGGEQDMNSVLSNPTGTPYGKALMTSGTDSTNQAYNSAVSGSRARANAAGFGYSQPVATGSTDQIEGQRAASLARLPGQVAQQAIQPGMQAAMAKMGTAGYYNPTSYFNTGASLQNSRMSQPSGWGMLANLGMQGLNTGLKAASVGGFA
jgi:hypothetical protein